jgi:hypothetical protein
MNDELLKAKLKLIHEQFIGGLYHQTTKDLVRTKTFFAGGCIRDMIRGKDPKDYDLYFFDEESRNKFFELVKDEFQFKETSIKNYNSKKMPIQVITVVTGMPENLIDTFDFTINQGYYIPQLDILKLGDLENVLIPGKHIFTPIQALLRAQRFLKQGYKLPAATLIEIGVQISRKPVTNAEELKSALMGMSYSEVFDSSPEVLNQVINRHFSDDIPF